MPPGPKVKILRLLGWKQTDLAKAAKIGLATIQRLDKGQGPVMAMSRP